MIRDGFRMTPWGWLYLFVCDTFFGYLYGPSSLLVVLLPTVAFLLVCVFVCVFIEKVYGDRQGAFRRGLYAALGIKRAKR
jgi:hypothetical protein